MTDRSDSNRTFTIVSVYALASAAWIAWSDRVLAALVRDPVALARFETAKGFVFVVATSAILYVAMGRQMGRSLQGLRTLRALNRAYRMTNACQSAIIRATDPRQLFDEICRIAVDDGGYAFAWVGMATHEGPLIVFPQCIHARNPADAGAIPEGAVIAADGPAGQTSTIRAVRTGYLSTWARDSDPPPGAPWGRFAERFGIRSAISVPIRSENRVIGCWTLLSDTATATDSSETALMQKLCATVNFAVEGLDRRKAKAGMIEHLRKLSLAVEQTPVSVIITDATGRIEYVNRKFSEVSGYSHSEVLGKNPRILRAPDSNPADFARMWETISSGQTWRGEFANIAKNGTLYWEYATVSPLRDETGNITHYIAMNEDVTAKRELELQLRHAQKMEVIGTLAGGIAHDFNNILTVIQGHCSLLALAKLASDLDRESVAEIQASVDRAAALTRQLLAFGRRQPMQTRTTDLNESAGKMVRLLRRVIPERIALEAALFPEPMCAHADPAMVDQVLMNLVLNARDAISGKGRIFIETASAAGITPPAYACDRGNGWIALRVTDDGSGIPEKDLVRVFEPFFTTKPLGKGTGLGLSVVDGVMRQHKGWVTVASEVGRGSTFSVFFPREPAVTAEAAPESPTAAPRGSETILVAEDEAPLRRMVARGLESLGYRVFTAPTAEEALEIWRRENGAVQLLLTDMVMPGPFGGDELARRLRQESPDLAVIYVSGYHTTPLAKTLGKEMRTQFLQKPFKPADLARLVRNLLDSR